MGLGHAVWATVRWVVLGLVVVVISLGIHPGAAGADGVLVLLSQDVEVDASATPATTKVVLELAGSGSVTGLTAATPLTDCKVTLDPTTLDAGKPTTVEATFADCKLADRPSIPVTISGVTGATPVSVSVPVTSSSSSAPPWELLWQALTAGVVAAVVVVGLAFGWSSESVGKARAKRGRLRYLGADWSFTDSWATTATLTGAVLTSVLAATDVLDLIVGDPSKVAVFTATNIVCAALVASSALIVLGLRPVDPDGPHLTLWGFGLGVLATLTAVFAQLWVVHLLVIDALEVSDRLRQELNGLLIVGAFAVLLYATSSVRAILREGTTDPGPEPDSDVEAGVKLVLKALNIQAPQDTKPPAPRGRMRLL